jgi:hypothetical protein
MPAARNSYTFKEGLTMMAAKAVGIDPYLAAEAGENARAAINAIRNAAKTKQPKDRAGYIREAQNELRTISAAQHPKLVNALQAKLLALQGRGGDSAVAHVAPGEMVIPRALFTPQLMQMITAEAARRGIDLRRLLVGGKGSVNPATGAEEFGIRDWVKGFFDTKSDDDQPGMSIMPREKPKEPMIWDMGIPPSPPPPWWAKSLSGQSHAPSRFQSSMSGNEDYQEANTEMASPSSESDSRANEDRRGPINREGNLVIPRFDYCNSLRTETERYQNDLCN